jgi:hypothetical protein
MTNAEALQVIAQANAAMARFAALPMAPCKKCGQSSKFAAMGGDELCLVCSGVLPPESRD